MPTFAELDSERFRGAVLIIDIDGTLTRDRGGMVDESESRKLRELSAISNVYLCSNAKDERIKSFAAQYGVSFLDTAHHKPSRRVLEVLPQHDAKVFVIGDKLITDGFFALNIGATFVEVKRFSHQNDSLAIRAIYAINDIVGFFLRPLFSALPFVVLMRPVQWIKNGLVFAPLFFAGRFLDANALVETLIASLVFCSAASAMYVLNDLFDREQDRLHPSKRGRPLASGSVSELGGWLLFSGLVLFTFGSLYLLPVVAPVLLAYMALNVLYSLFLKHLPFIDILAVALSYVLRIIAGGLATATYVSPWIVLCVFFGALFIVTGKRRAELRHTTRRKVLAMYSQKLLDALLVSAAVAALISYGLYSVLGAHVPYVAYSTIFVAAAIFRFLVLLFHSKDAEYPDLFILKDPLLLVTSLIWAMFMGILSYIL